MKERKKSGLIKVPVVCIFLLLSGVMSVYAQTALGDVNTDGSIDIVDGLLVAQFYVGLDPANFNQDVADVNADTSIDIVDALLIAQFYVGLITEFPGQSATPVPTNPPPDTPAPTGAPEPIFSGGPYALDGSSGYVDLPDGLTNNLNDFSIACWVNLSSLDTWTRIFDFGGDTNIFMMLTPASGNTGYPYFCITLTGNPGEQGLDGTSALSTGSWQHLAVTRSGNTAVLYINTQEVDRNTGMTLNPADMGNTTNNFIGRSQWPNDPYLNGEVDQFVVYNRALSASEVADLGSSGSSPEPTQTPEPTDTPGPTDPPQQSGVIGWASQNGGTTGGSGGSSATVYSFSELQSAVSGSDGRIVRISGTISGSGMMSIGSNKTILGSGTSSVISGFGLNISGQKNIIIQNITFTNADDDSINVQEYTTNLWIDHCSFTNGYDGLVDIKRGSSYITVSWNHFYNHGKTCLLGHSDDNASQDVGNLKVTYHHNFFDNTDTRHPRIRFGHVHVFNNYYIGNEYGVASTMNADVLVEGNYFSQVDDPTLVGYGSSGPGDLVERNNIYDNCQNGPQTQGSVASFPYSYSLDNASTIPSIVRNGAGVGKI